VVHVGERLAEVRGVPATRIAEITTANGRHVYGI
jgi:hypothetical protein